MVVTPDDRTPDKHTDPSNGQTVDSRPGPPLQAPRTTEPIPMAIHLCAERAGPISACNLFGSVEGVDFID